MKPFVFIVLLAAFLSGCDSESLQQDEPATESGIIVIGEYGLDNLGGDAFELKTARIEGNDLMLDVAYSGGCAEHSFGGFAPEVAITIFPPQITVFVVHDGNGDECEAYPSETVSLDLLPLLNAFGSGFVLTVVPVDSSSDPVVIHQAS